MKYSDFPFFKPSAKSLSFRSPVYGVGINDADYIVQPLVDGKQLRCPIYRIWSHMLERCYSHEWHVRWPSYIGCSVDQRWHSFMAFREWVLAQSEWEGMELDKDLLVSGNKLYSPETCLFVTRQVNQFIASMSIPTSISTGVRAYPKHKGKYIVRVTFHNGYRWSSKLIDNLELALLVYSERKSQAAYFLAHSLTDLRVKTALVSYIY